MKRSRIKVYPIPDEATLAAFKYWAIVRYNPALVKESGSLPPADSSERWWVPIARNGIDWPVLYRLGVVDIKVANGKRYASMCLACDKRLMCVVEGRDINPAFRCTASARSLIELTGDLVTIQRKNHDRGKRPAADVTITADDAADTDS